MLFNSFSFLIFFPVVVLCYFLLPHRVRYLWLLVASYYFYMCWNPKYALLMALSTAITYLSGLLIHRAGHLRNQRKAVRLKKLWVALSFGSNLAILFFFKYFNFAVDNLNALLSRFHMSMVVPGFDVILPVGISFYTFQALSYTMDVYREEISAERNPLKYALFVSFFPQLVAGPIERSKNLLSQVGEYHPFDYDRVRQGLQLMLWGFFQKLVIADRAAILVNQVYNHYNDYGGFQLAIATMLFAVQIYCDFSSYSDIAIGAAQVMGFRLMQNFRQPYFSTSIAEFWRNWHISLSTWFRDYLYIPLGGNRRGRARKYLNLLIVFLASGLWHGANWAFVMWGLLHGLYQVVGDITRPLRMALKRALHVREEAFSTWLYQVCITFALTNVAWVFFRAASIPDCPSAVGAAFEILRRTFAQWNPEVLFTSALYEMGLDEKNFRVLFLALAVLLVVSILRRQGLHLRETLCRQGLLLRWGVYLSALFAVLIFGIYGPGYDASAFIYFQF